MTSRDEEFLKKLLITFGIEAEEHLAAISSGVLRLEAGVAAAEYPALVESVFRETHSLKGAARAVSLRDIETLCQNLESVFAEMKKGQIHLAEADYDLIHQVLDTVHHLLSGPNEEVASDSRRLSLELKDLIIKKKEVTPEEKPPARQKSEVKKDTGSADAGPVQPRDALPSPAEKPQQKPPQVPQPCLTVPGESSGAETIKSGREPEKQPSPQNPISIMRISSAKFESLFHWTDELVPILLASSQHSADLRHLSSTFMDWRWNISKVMSDYERLKADISTPNRQITSIMHDLSRLLQFFEYNREFVHAVHNSVASFTRQSVRSQFELETIHTGLTDEMREILLLPASSLFDIFPRMVRDLSQARGKKVTIICEGGSIEIDRRVLEVVKDPLIHLVRNCIDHGIEDPVHRTQSGKDETGTILVSFSYTKGSRVQIVVRDDGQGLLADEILAAAIRKKILTEEEGTVLTKEEVLNLIFQSDLSTSRIITDTSGRGLGLAIVKEKVEWLGGLVSVQTDPGRGASFSLTIPLTLATFQGLLLTTGNRLFVLPVKNISLVGKARTEQVTSVENRMVLDLPSGIVYAYHLEEILGIPHDTKKKGGELPYVVIESSGRKAAFLVDSIQTSQDLLVKNLGKQLKRVRHFSGATILGDGRVVPVIQPDELLDSALSYEIREVHPAKEAKPEKQSVLVVEDSITSRMMLKNIIEGAGYHVETAIDGLDGFIKLKEGTFDIVISDVDMPRMNGFGLCEKIRGEKSLEEIPIVLVTSLDSAEDKEHGIRVGADAYIIKSSFDQSNLLNVIRRLI